MPSSFQVPRPLFSPELILKCSCSSRLNETLDPDSLDVDSRPFRDFGPPPFSPPRFPLVSASPLTAGFENGRWLSARSPPRGMRRVPFFSLALLLPSSPLVPLMCPFSVVAGAVSQFCPLFLPFSDLPLDLFSLPPSSRGTSLILLTS